ncbi:hypothetical protein IAE33_002253 [Pseudomonas sp. S60]|uniref:hypothetical protein n=1 Tax=Pseudomonas sp. S60 TaxID=211124 RepID=UPI0019127576|nr:hypothetical protein [Pseudomonas sp. S60]MBK5010393.1 hypothetical protein [Pseudomonas sp. S60]
MTHKARSFIATLQVNGCPVNTFDSMTRGQVVLESPLASPAHALDGASVLGMLNCSDEDWQHGQDLGLITFERAAAPAPLLLYFRHSDEGYRLYIRSGPHFGQGVFVTEEGLVAVKPIEQKDPTLWSVIAAATGEHLDVITTETDEIDISLVSTDNPLGLQSLFPVGGYAMCHAAADRCTLRLAIEQRDVDWYRSA